MYALQDPRSGLALWLHLGTVPTDWHLWEDRIYAWLPGGGGLLSLASYHATRLEDRPGGAVMGFRCVEPFRRWRVTLDGFALHTEVAVMDRGEGPSRRRRLRLELEVDCVSPVWDARHADGHGREGMAAQSWAKEHYQQLVRAHGWMELDGRRTAVEATGWRDHSRGPRGSKEKDAWGGHALDATLRTESSIWVPRERKHQVGRDLHGALGDMYVLNWGPVTWAGNTAIAYLERSAHLNALPAGIA